MKLQHIVIYLRQFATLLKAGVSVVDATRILAEQTESKPLKKALLDVEHDLREGKPLIRVRLQSIKKFFRLCLLI